MLVFSNVRLGAYKCHAKELIDNLKSINPKKVVFNGNTIDTWQFSKSY